MKSLRPNKKINNPFPFPTMCKICFHRRDPGSATKISKLVFACSDHNVQVHSPFSPVGLLLAGHWVSSGGLDRHILCSHRLQSRNPDNWHPSFLLPIQSKQDWTSVTFNEFYLIFPLSFGYEHFTDEGWVFANQQMEVFFQMNYFRHDCYTCPSGHTF